MTKDRTFRAEIRNRVLTQVYSIPPLFLFFARLKYWSSRERIVNSDTALAIGGFPRSANTFASNAFRFAQPQSVTIAHHTHSAGQIMAAIYYGIPAIVLIRHPKDAIVSLALRNPTISIPSAISNYFLFYRTLLGKPGYVLAKFEDVVADFGAVISRVNEKFGTSFTPYISSEENNRKVFEIIEKRHLQITKGQSVNELGIARPSQARNQAKPQIEAMLDANYSEQLQKAEVLWQDFCSQG